MQKQLTRQDALRLRASLQNAPVAPGSMASWINVGTDAVLDVLERQYFEGELQDGISCFKYLEGDYGTGKSQFINCLAQRARARGIVTSLVDVGIECPFSSPVAIFRRVVSSFLPLSDSAAPSNEQRGIELLLKAWVDKKLVTAGVTPGDFVPDSVRQLLERPFLAPPLGAADPQMASALTGLGRRLVAMSCGATQSTTDQELIGWIRGDAIRSTNLKQLYALYEPATDATAFQRLKTVISFLRERLGYKGFLVAFDEGTRVMSFRRGTAKQRQAIENMLTMINQNAEGEFGGVMFVYAATPDLRAEVIQSSYTALNDRIGSVAYAPGRPMTPLIKLDDLNSDKNLEKLGGRLLEVFEIADGSLWNHELQQKNMSTLIEAERRALAFFDTVPPRFFVYHWCRFLASQRDRELQVDLDEAIDFVQNNRLPDVGDL